MRRVILPILAALLVISADAAALKQETTCQCLEQPLDKRWKIAEGAFAGKVTNVEEVKQWSQRGNRDLPVIVTVTVDEAFKGVEKGDQVKFHSNVNHDTCMGAEFGLGKSYLFFAYARKEAFYEYWSLYAFDTGTLDVGGLCGGTKNIDDPLAAQEMEQMRTMTTDAPLLKKDKNGFIGMPPEKGTDVH